MPGMAVGLRISHVSLPAAAQHLGNSAKNLFFCPIPQENHLTLKPTACPLLPIAPHPPALRVSTLIQEALLCTLAPVGFADSQERLQNSRAQPRRPLSHGGISSLLPAPCQS